MRGIRLVPQECNVNFIGLKNIAFILSACAMIAAIALIARNGLNMGIDFTGGTVIEIRTPVTPDLEYLRSKLNDLNLGSVSIQEFGQIDDLLIRLPEQKETEQETLQRKQCLKDKTPEACPNANQQAISTVQSTLSQVYEGQEIDYRRIEFVGPQVGKELKLKGLYAIIFSLAGILTYIWFRFEWQFGVAAIVALAHDSLATIGLFAFTQMEFNLSTVAAILMIAGYSINDTVVVFDRIRENLRKYKKKPLPELFNYSVNQTLSRTLMTSVTTLLALIALYVFGGEVIRGFVYALIFGILIGTYSSVFVASPVLLMLNIKRGTVAEISDSKPSNTETV